MKTKLTIIAIAAATIGLLANTGGLPKIEDRVADLEKLAVLQAEEIQVLKAKIEDIRPSPFTEIEAARLQYLSGVFAVVRDTDEIIGGTTGWGRVFCQVGTYNPDGSIRWNWTLYLGD